jgi:hypothetical protein
MAKDLLTPIVPANLLEQAIPTASLTAQRNWIRDGLFRSPIPPAVAGKPRLYPLLGAYEAGLLGHASATGIPIEVVSRAFHHRIDEAGEQQISQERGGPVTSFWEGESYEAAVRSQTLREFETRSPDAAAYWLINVTQRGNAAKYGWLTVCNRDGLPRAFLSAEQHKERSGSSAILTICVTDVVTAIDNELRKLGIEIEPGQ